MMKQKKSVCFKTDKRTGEEGKEKRAPLKEDNGVGDLISRMKTLNLSEQKYRAFWAEVGRTDPNLHRRLRGLSAYTSEVTSEPQRDLPPHLAPNNQGCVVQNKTRDYDVNQSCYSCGKIGHTVGRCDVLRALTEEGVIKRGSNGRMMWNYSAPIIWRGEDTIAEAVNRKIQHAALVTITAEGKEEWTTDSDSDSSVEGTKRRRPEFWG